jgi:hypothetical protein
METPDREFPRETAGMMQEQKAKRPKKNKGVARKRAKRIAHRRQGKRG